MNQFALGPRLLADVGGTNARFALETSAGRFDAVATLPCAAYASLREAVGVYLAGCGHDPAAIGHAAIAIANPIDGDAVRMTNHHWSFSIDGLRRDLALDTLLVVNDFTALAMALPHLSEAQRVQVGGGSGVDGRTIGLVGAGTGLGVSGIVPLGGRWVALASEGGHASFAPFDDTEEAILRHLRCVHGHVSNERLLSGAGLEAIHHALCGDVLAAAEISARALAGSCADCARSVDVFCAVLGGVAGDVALTLGATGGMYIGGGIVPRLGRLFGSSPFRARFEAKGRLSGYLARIPTYVITEEYPAFLGVSAILAAQMANTEPTNWR
jgi:glucokinase